MPEAVTPDELLARLGMHVRAHCKRLGLSIEALADKAGVSRRHLWAVLAGRYSPSLAYLAKLAAALEVDPLDLLRPVRR